MWLAESDSGVTREPVALEAVDEMATTTLSAKDIGYGDRLLRALGALPVEQREVISLKIDGELTFAQIAKVLEVSPHTAASRYRYALEKLRRSLSIKGDPSVTQGGQVRSDLEK